MVTQEKGSKDMKKYGFLMVALLTLGAFGAESYQFVSDRYNIFSAAGDYIQVNEDLESFNLSSDFGTVGGSGRVGYYTYEGNLSYGEMASKVNSSIREGNMSAKRNGGINMNNLSAGQKIGFYLVRNNGHVVTDWQFVQDRNGSIGIQFNRIGPGIGREVMFFKDIVIKGTGDIKMAGTPLPGFLPTLLMGALGLAGTALRKHRKVA